MSKLKYELIKIAGANALASNDQDIAKMSKAINYFALQVRIAISDIEDAETRESTINSFNEVCDWTAEILQKEKSE